MYIKAPCEIKRCFYTYKQKGKNIKDMDDNNNELNDILAEIDEVENENTDEELKNQEQIDIIDFEKEEQTDELNETKEMIINNILIKQRRIKEQEKLIKRLESQKEI